MGRFYYGDIEGKFWFGVQDSFDADNFGVEGEVIVDEDGEMRMVAYDFTKDHLHLIEGGIFDCEEEIGGQLELLDKFFSEKDGYTYLEVKEFLGMDSVEDVKELLGYYSRLHLGRKILACVKESGSCSFEGEL